MKVFGSDDLPKVKFNFELYLYNTASHAATQNGKPIWFFMLFRHSESGAAAILQCCEGENQNWISPARAPFGGVQYDGNSTIEEISFLLHCAEQWVIKNGGERLTIKSCPDCYLPKTQVILPEYYVPSGYKIIKNNINHSISVTVDIYADNIHISEKRKLRKCIAAGFTCSRQTNPSVDIVYDFINYCRKTRGYETSLTRSQLNDLLTKLPDKIVVFEVKDGDKIVAMSVSVLVNKVVLYNFLPASLPSYNSYSPTVILTEGIYRYCQEQKIEVLDLGISLDNHGIEKDTLMRFKENLGSVRSQKRTYEKILSRN